MVATVWTWTFVSSANYVYIYIYCIYCIDCRVKSACRPAQRRQHIFLGPRPRTRVFILLQTGRHVCMNININIYIYIYIHTITSCIYININKCTITEPHILLCAMHARWVWLTATELLAPLFNWSMPNSIHLCLAVTQTAGISANNRLE